MIQAFPCWCLIASGSSTHTNGDQVFITISNLKSKLQFSLLWDLAQVAEHRKSPSGPPKFVPPDAFPLLYRELLLCSYSWCYLPNVYSLYYFHFYWLVKQPERYFFPLSFCSCMPFLKEWVYNGQTWSTKWSLKTSSLYSEYNQSLLPKSG